AFSGVIAAVGVSALLSHLLPAADATQSVILLVGMAVGVDYSLFYLKREREERAKGLEPHAALLRTAATSGEAVLISGATVLVAAAVPAFSLQTKFLSINDLPHSIPIVNTVLRLNQSFPGTTVPAVVVVQAPNVNDPRVTAGIAAMGRAAVASGRLTRPIEVARNPSATVARVTIPIKSSDSRTAAAYAGLAT